MRAHAAQVYTETFATNLSGWIGSTVNSGDGSVWIYTNGQAKLKFIAQDPFGGGYSDQGILFATNTSSSGRFTGNWTTSGVNTIGFDLISDTVDADAVEVRLSSGNNYFYKTLVPPPPGVLESYLIAADGLASGGWIGIPTNSEAAFATMKTNVQSIKLAISRSGIIAQTNRLDNIFLSQLYRWDGGPAGTGAVWLASSNWFPDGIPGTNCRVAFGSTGSAAVIGIDSSQATGGVLQVGQLFCTVSNRIFENSATTNDSKLQFAGYNGIFVSADTNTVTFRNGSSRRLELVGGRYHGEFSVNAGGSIIVSNCLISESTNVACRLDKTGAGYLYLGVSNKYSGGTLVNGGTLRIDNTNALGSGGFTAGGGLLDLNGYSITVPWLAGSTGIISDASAGAATTTVTVVQNTNITFAAALSNGASKIIALTKNGTGTLWIAGTNFNTGVTLVNTGRLFLVPNGPITTNDAPIAELGNGPVIVSTGATFGGVGRVRGTLFNGGTVTPGDPTGVLVCAAGYVQQTNATLSFTIGGTNPAQNNLQLVYVTSTNLIIYVTTNIDVGVTNVTTNVTTNVYTSSSADSSLHNRMTIQQSAALAGIIRVSLTNGYTPSNGAVFQVISCGTISGSFSTNSFLTNNLPSPGTGKEWGILYSAGGVALSVVSSGPPSVFVSDASVIEGNGGTTNLIFSISLSKPPTSAVTIVYATSNGTASAGSDYIATNGTLIIPAGSVTGGVTVVVNGDTAFENNETLQLNILSLSNAALGRGSGIGTILDDDTVPSAAIGDVTQNEGGGLFMFPVVLSAVAGADISVDFTSSNGTAVAGTDYIATNGTLVIPAGTATGFVSVAVIDNSMYEADKTFQVIIQNPVNVTITDATAIGTILNDDALPLVSIGDVLMFEGNSSTRKFIFPVTLTDASSLPASVTFSTLNDTAIAGTDYMATNGTVTIPAGATSTSIVVIIYGNTVREPDRDFFVLLSNPSNATIETGIGTGVIRDDDFSSSNYYAYSLQIPSPADRSYNADPDGDGYPNLLEYVTGSNPTNFDDGSAMSAIWTNGTLAMCFQRATNSIDATLYIEDSTSPDAALAAWSCIASNTLGVWRGSAVVIETGTSSPRNVVVQDPVQATNRFMRLRVTKP